MIESDFATIQKLLGVTLPRAYRRLMSAYPFHDDPPSDAYIPDNASYVCKLNQQIRDDSVYGDLWRPVHFALGTSWEGDAFVLDTDLSNSPIFRFSQEQQTVATVAANLDQWVSMLRQWYVDFQSVDVAVLYRELVAAVRNAGFFATTPEPMDGWHRICVMSERKGGKSFWVSTIGDGWFVGDWGGNIYLVPSSPAEFCVVCLRLPFGDNGAEFPVEIKSNFSLKSVTDLEFQDLVAGA